MRKCEIEAMLAKACALLSGEAQKNRFESSLDFEQRVRSVLAVQLSDRALQLLENDMIAAAARMNDELFVEYWGESCPPKKRINRWLEKADRLATGWKPSRHLFNKKEK